MSIENQKVALVLDPNFGDELIELSMCMPVWIIDSTKNRMAFDGINSAKRSEANVTIFPQRGQESMEGACMRIIQSLDEHHNESSQHPGYKELVIFGVSLGSLLLESFNELGFSHFFATEKGFIAKKML